VDIDQAAKLTESKTGSEIKEIVRRALLKSVDQEILTNADFLFAINS
jgi:SpoVK/Ycf46/Vps4 family AAA+-type ATPase